MFAFHMLFDTKKKIIFKGARPDTYVRTYVRTYERTYVRTYVRTYIPTYARTDACTHTCTHARTYLCTCLLLATSKHTALTLIRLAGKIQSAADRQRPIGNKRPIG